MALGLNPNIALTLASCAILPHPLTSLDHSLSIKNVAYNVKSTDLGAYCLDLNPFSIIYSLSDFRPH